MRWIRVATPALLAFALALMASGVLSVRNLDALPTSPLLTLILEPVARALMFVSGSVAVGGALVGGVLGQDERALRIGGRSALVFAAASAVVALTALADLLAAQVWQAFDGTMLFSFVTQIDEGRYLMLQVVLASTAALIMAKVNHPIDAALGLGTMLVAVVLPGFTGHSSAALSHWMASASMLLHLAAMNLWVGGVIVLFAAYNAQALARFSRVAMAAYVALILSGLANLVTRIGDWGVFWHSSYLVVLALKVLLALALGAFAATKLRRTTALALEGGEAVAVIMRRALGLEVTLMLMAVAFGVVLARMANP
ncbi:MAG: copper resistance D family protein [Candidatus Nanopelagicales bacterium]